MASLPYSSISWRRQGAARLTQRGTAHHSVTRLVIALGVASGFLGACSAEAEASPRETPAAHLRRTRRNGVDGSPGFLQPSDVPSDGDEDFEDWPRGFWRESIVEGQNGAGGYDEGNVWSDASVAALTDAWQIILTARKAGPHQHHDAPSLAEDPTGALASAVAGAPSDWYFLAVILGALLTLDFLVLQHLPETVRTHSVLAIFWILVGSTVGTLLWLRLGAEAGASWAAGYALEIVYSVDYIVVVHLVFRIFDTPRRLMAKAMFVALLGSILARLVLFSGLADSIPDQFLEPMPIVLGIWLVYCGFSQVRVVDASDVTQAAAVRALRGVMGKRLGEFYDEEGEGLLAIAGGGLCLTLLGVVIACLLAADVLFAADVVLTKTERLPNAYLNISSSALAMFEVRALFFVAHDMLNSILIPNHGVGIALLFLGSEMLLSRAFYISALTSAAVVILIMATSSFMPSLIFTRSSGKEALAAQVWNGAS